MSDGVFSQIDRPDATRIMLLCYTGSLYLLVTPKIYTKV